MELKLLFWTLVWVQFLCPLRSPAGSTQPRPQQWLKTEVVQSHIIRFVCLTEYSLWYCQRKTFTTTFIPFQIKWFMTHAYKASRWVNKSSLFLFGKVNLLLKVLNLIRKHSLSLYLKMLPFCSFLLWISFYSEYIYWTVWVDRVLSAVLFNVNHTSY